MIEHGFTTRQVAEATGLSPTKISRWARAGLVSPAVTSSGDAIFSFQDVVLFRTARDLLNADVPERKIRAAVAALRRQLPSDLPLSALRISALGEAVLVRDEGGTWEAATGQLHLFGEAARPQASVAVAVGVGAAVLAPADECASADRWYDEGVDLEATDPESAAEAYGRALALEPGHADANLNLGRLLHEAGDLEGAEARYRAAAEAAPTHAGARYNLGVVLEDLKRWSPAIAAYREALRLDDRLAAAHFNLARLLQAKGQRAAALRHLARYRDLAG
ncbi:MAG: tetratricopeptide repeat protein [Gemmatimonadales bacterium]